jgi:hypothetical protein|tara:strand:+ start:1827 stop:3203 length:1377 start_codon:yes stop_codon:yes gene_type:complete
MSNYTDFFPAGAGGGGTGIPLGTYCHFYVSGGDGTNNTITTSDGSIWQKSGTLNSTVASYPGAQQVFALNSSLAFTTSAGSQGFRRLSFDPVNDTFGTIQYVNWNAIYQEGYDWVTGASISGATTYRCDGDGRGGTTFNDNCQYGVNTTYVSSSIPGGTPAGGGQAAPADGYGDYWAFMMGIGILYGGDYNVTVNGQTNFQNYLSKNPSDRNGNTLTGMGGLRRVIGGSAGVYTYSTAAADHIDLTGLNIPDAFIYSNGCSGGGDLGVQVMYNGYQLWLIQGCSNNTSSKGIVSTVTCTNGKISSLGNFSSEITLPVSWCPNGRFRAADGTTEDTDWFWGSDAGQGTGISTATVSKYKMTDGQLYTGGGNVNPVYTLNGLATGGSQTAGSNAFAVVPPYSSVLPGAVFASTAVTSTTSTYSPYQTGVGDPNPSYAPIINTSGATNTSYVNYVKIGNTP